MFFVFISTGVPETLIEISKEKWPITIQRKKFRGRNYKYKENYINEVNAMHGVSEYKPKGDTFELFEKGKENRFDEPKQKDDTVQLKQFN